MLVRAPRYSQRIVGAACGFSKRTDAVRSWPGSGSERNAITISTRRLRPDPPRCRGGWAACRVPATCRWVAHGKRSVKYAATTARRAGRSIWSRGATGRRSVCVDDGFVATDEAPAHHVERRVLSGRSSRTRANVTLSVEKRMSRRGCGRDPYTSSAADSASTSESSRGLVRVVLGI